jgi:hypothetical protein
MRLELYQWNSHNINDSTNYQAVIQPGNSMPSATANFIDIGQGNPVLAGKTLDGGYFTIHIILRGNVETQRDELNGWFSPADFTPHKLVALDKDNSDKDWYLEGYPVTPPMIAEGVAKYSITLALTTPYWIENDLNTDTWAITSPTDTNVITAVGNVPALPTFVITPNSAKDTGTGWKKKTFKAIHTNGWGMQNLPVDITDGGWDTATIVGAGDMLASGNDVRVSVNGVDVMRWPGGGGWNNAATKIWVTLNFSVQPTLALATTLDNSTLPATINITYTDVTITLPQNSTFQIGTELFTYSSYTVNASTKTITFTMVERGAKGSTKATHAIADTAYWIENEIWILYDNSGAAAPAYLSSGWYTELIPAIDLVNSTNASFIYATFGIGYYKGQAPMTPVRSGTISYLNNYVSENYAGAPTDPPAVIGLGNSLGGFGSGIQFPYVAWGFYHAGTISNFKSTCDTIRYSTVPEWPTNVIITNKNDGTGTVYYNIPSPSTDSAWEPLSIDVVTSSKNIYFFMTGAQNPMPIALAELQDATLTIANPPTITSMGAAQENYTIGGSLKNNTTVETVVFNGVVTKTTLALTINCETQEVYNADGRRVRGMLSFNGEKRDEWITLQAGANTLAWSDAGTNDLTIVTTWRSRNTI